LAIGAPVFGSVIPAGAVVNAILDSQTFIISLPVTASATGINLTARLGDAIGLNRITEFDEPTEMVYGVQVSVTNGTDAGKTFFLAANVNVTFDDNFTPAVPIYTPTLWKQDALTPNISLLANSAPINDSPITNNIDINGLSGGGTISLGGSSSMGSGSATFSGNVVLQNGSITLTGGSTTAAAPLEVTVDSTAQVAVGMLITGPKMPDGATVVSVKDGHTFVLNLPTTGASPVGSLTLVASYAPTTRYIRLLSDSLDARGVVFSGSFSEADLTGDKLGLQKLGTGTVTLSSGNTYRGGTTVNSGTLLVNNNVGTGSGTGTGEVTVQNFGSTLGGIGTISGKTTIGSGATLSPGNPSTGGGLGALSFLGDVYMGPGSLASFEIGGSDADFLSIAGTFSVDSTASLIVRLTNNFVPSTSLSYDLITWGLPSSLNLVDLLDLPSLVDESFFWDTSLFNTEGKLALSQRSAGDPPVARFAVRSARVAETDGTDVVIKVAIQLDTPVADSLDIPLLLTGGTATESSGGVQADYDILPAPIAPSTSHVVHFDNGQTSAEVTIIVHNDPRAESSETVNLSFVAQPNALQNNARLKGSPGSFTLTIDDNDSASAAGSRWVLRNPAPTNERMQGLAAGTTATSPVAVFTTVAVGSGGRILQSLDNGTTWKPILLGLTTDLHSVAVRPAVGALPAQFVAVGDEGLILTSPDGLSWTYHTASGEKKLQSVVWSAAAAKFVSVGEGGVLFSSVTGESWTYHDSGVNRDLTSVTFANGLFVAVGMNGVVTTSVDGLSWAAGVTGTPLSLRAVAFKAGSPNGIFMAVGDSGVFLTSLDAVTWTPGVITGTPNLRSLHVESANNRFIAGGLGGVIYTFTGNGPTWAAMSTTGTSEDLLAGLSQGSGNVSLMTGAAGTFITHPSSSANGWTRTGAPNVNVANAVPTSEFSGVAFNGARFVTLGYKGIFGSSVSDSFTFGTMTGGLANSHMNAAASRSTGQLVAVGDGGLAAISQAGLTWAATSSTSVSVNLNGIIFAKGAYYAVGESGTILLGTVNDTTSTVAWTPISSGSTNTLQSIAYNGSLFLAVGNNGTVLSSPDGVFWEDLNPGGLPDLTGITWTGSQFIVVGAGGTILTSPDGGVFTKQAVSISNNLNDVVWTPTGGYAVGAGGVILGSSANGVTWTLLNSGTSQDLKDIAWNENNGRLTAVGTGGTILTSDPLTTVRPAAFFVVSEMTVDERAGVVNVPVFFTQIPSTDLYLRYTVSSTGLNSPATLTTDYTAAASPLKLLLSSITPAEIAEGTITRNIAITLKSDAVKELNPEHLKIRLGNPDPAHPDVDNFVTSLGKPLTTPQPGDVLDPREFVLTITDTVPPSVDFNPETQHQMVGLGQAISLHTEVTGSFPTISWLKNGIVVPGAIAADYNIAAATVTNAGTYVVKAVNPAGTDTTNNKTKALAAPLGTAEISVVNQSDQLVLVKSGGPTILTAVAAGNGLVYQWYLGSTPLFSGTSYTVAGAKLTIKVVSPGVNEGDYHCNVSQTGVGHNTGLALDTGVFHVKTAELPDIQPPVTTAPRGKVGALYSFTLPRPSSSDPLSPKTPISYTMTGQPAGLTINAKTGVISGIPTAATTVDKQVIVKATNPAGVTTIGFALGIDPLEPTALGTFIGLVDRSQSSAVDAGTKLAYGTLGLGARLDLTTTAAATFSGKVFVGPTLYPFTGKLVTTASDNPAPHDPQGTFTIARGVGKSSLVFNFTLNPDNTITGTVTDAKGSTPLNGWRNQWTAASKVPAAVTVIHNFIADKIGGPATDGSEPEGSSFGSITPAVLGTGAVTAAGKTADGMAFTTAGIFGPNGETLVYQSLYTIPGTFCGVLKVDLDTSPAALAVQKVTGALTWSHPKQTTGRTFLLGWPAAPLNLGVDGGKYYPATANPATGPQVVMNLVDTTANGDPVNANLEFSGGLVTSTTSPSPSLTGTNGVQVKPFKAATPAVVVLPTGANNPDATTLVINNATGGFSGFFTLTDPDALGGKPFARRVAYQGVIVPKTLTPDVYDGVGYGYFLLPKRPSSTAPVTTTATSPILSGLVIFESNQ
ncbi:MAG: hypothetical protein JWO08_4764, partial [Verrucomicrobiaceae bacterium]|nr:hypothetical protein [Verrucomicrobiaceae bacterium]